MGEYWKAVIGAALGALVVMATQLASAVQGSEAPLDTITDINAWLWAAASGLLVGLGVFAKANANYFHVDELNRQVQAYRDSEGGGMDWRGVVLLLVLLTGLSGCANLNDAQRVALWRCGLGVAAGVDPVNHIDDLPMASRAAAIECLNQYARGVILEAYDGHGKF